MHIDTLLCKIHALNSILTGTKYDKKRISEWDYVAQRICKRLLTINHVSVGEPSDGHPQEESIPWVGLFRPVQTRKLEWLIAWPDEDYLHP